MKKVFLSIGLIAGISCAAQAQGVKFGVKAGASLTDLTNGDGNAYKFGFNGGVLANFGFNDMISIQPEVLYSMKGTKNKDNSDNRINMNYIDVPVLVKVATGATGLFFEAGPQVGFLASAKYKVSGADFDVKDAFKSVDFGYAAGLGFQVASGPMVGLRYNGGFTNVGKDATVNGVKIESGNVKNSAFQLYVGYTFGGK
ncbi:outer membrane beta-barrel protein [Hymenobacter sp. HMF4947]|uniref:Outer membrane beta-barrel protein n=1 Tax=Hymenobacter ginkgonis TaxID=2682976 RepID=A0A7K1THQ5_9BACT|nr:porin family protein [Hymenobacter ginkgonis]MVN77882.1 outer membrane beta-barrel protein [Hymenobacter ginkgonis]